MKIIDKMNQGGPFVSLEFFPPKDKREWSSFFRVTERLARIDPLFVSVTYGAGGSTQGDTLEIVTRLKREQGLEAMAHLTCVGAELGALRDFLSALAGAGVDNVLALRGDLPKDTAPEAAISSSLRHACDLVRFIREAHPELGVGVAGYPETHPEAQDPETDLDFLHRKLEQGGDFAITQLFFENEHYFEFVRRARAAGITKPIVPGILPVVSLKVIRRIISLCGSELPPAYLAQLEEAERSGGAAAVQRAGIAYARKQLEGLLAAGVPGVHLYTLNRDELVLELVDGLLPA